LADNKPNKLILLLLLLPGNQTRGFGVVSGAILRCNNFIIYAFQP